MRRPPHYWWDFRHNLDGSMTIVLETDDPRCASGVIRETGKLPKGDCQDIIDQINQQIADLTAGRAALEEQG